MRGSSCPMVVSGDFNVKSQEWASPSECGKGKVMADLMAANGLVVCSHGEKPTFVRGASESL